MTKERIRILIAAIATGGLTQAQQTTDTVLHQLQQLIDAGRFESALVVADTAVARYATSALAYKLRGDVHQHLQEYDQALRDYRSSQELDDQDPRLYVSRSALRITEGNLKGAMRDLDKAIELDPDDPDIWYNRACANYLGQDNNKALRDAERALKLREDHADALFLTGVVKGELYREADGLDDIRKALALKPDIPGGRMSAAILLHDLERWREAIDAFTVVIQANGDEEEVRDAYYYRGDCFYNMDQKEQACENWRTSARMGDNDSIFIVKNYCETDEKKIPKKPVRRRRKTVIQF
ncbi:MAG: tetratricopeptide repeat protein [Flavobacteriales bacterium]|nr:tetratricopeptide repeat protein [Flavobacteriales bacterium]MCB9168282.1 tetratricopeptide repeat protein [Flavobacteriales bacterium]